MSSYPFGSIPINLPGLPQMNSSAPINVTAVKELVYKLGQGSQLNNRFYTYANPLAGLFNIVAEVNHGTEYQTKFAVSVVPDEAARTLTISAKEDISVLKEALHAMLRALDPDTESKFLKSLKEYLTSIGKEPNNMISVDAISTMRFSATELVDAFKKGLLHL